MDILDPEKSEIESHIIEVEEALFRALSWDWERDHECQDLGEQVARLQAQLRQCGPFASNWLRDDGGLVQPALGVTYQRGEAEVQRTSSSLRIFGGNEPPPLEAKVEKLQSENWELQEKCADLDEQVRRLRRQLRNSVPVGRIAENALQPKTALEVALERRVGQLEQRVRELEGGAGVQPGDLEGSPGNTTDQH